MRSFIHPCNDFIDLIGTHMNDWGWFVSLDIDIA